MSNNTPQFDKHQFFRNARAISAETEISYQDFGRMGIEEHRAHLSGRETPAFMLDEKKIQRVLIQIGWQYVHGGLGNPPENTTLEELKKQIEKHVETCWSNRGIRSCKTHSENIKRNGGYLQMRAKVMWLAWRMNMNSVDIAKETGIDPRNVRTMLERVRVAARKVFPEDVPPINEKKAFRKKHFDDDAVVALVQSVGVRAAANKLGRRHETIRRQCKDWERKTGKPVKFFRKVRESKKIVAPKISLARVAGNIVRRQKTAAVKTRKLRNTEKAKYIYELRLSGKSFNEIGRIMGNKGISVHLMCQRYCLRNGLSVPARARRFLDVVELIRLRESERMTWKEVGKATGFNPVECCRTYLEVRRSHVKRTKLEADLAVLRAQASEIENQLAQMA